MHNALQDYLRIGGSIESLQEKYVLKAKRHCLWSNLVHFSYSQIDSPFSEEIVRHARGTILDENDNWKIVNWGFQKFGNVGESYAAEIDWSTARVYEKLDGSCIFLWWYGGQWNVSTTGTPDAQAASGDMQKCGPSWKFSNELSLPAPRSFEEYFWQVLKNARSNIYNVLRFPSSLTMEERKYFVKDYCFAFELMGPLNPVVIPQKPDIKLLFCRNLETFEEMNCEEANARFFSNEPNFTPITYDLKGFAQLIESLKGVSGLEHEGYVVYDGRGRVKLKNPDYLIYHRMKDGFSERNFLDKAMIGETGEVKAVFPQYAEEITEVEDRYYRLIQRIDNDWDAISHLKNGDRKTFALAANQAFYPGAMFSLLLGKVKARQEGTIKIPESKIECAREFLEGVGLEKCYEIYLQFKRQEGKVEND